MVRCKVTMLSQPEAFVKVCVGATAGVEVYSVPYHVKLSQAKAVVSPVLLCPTVRCNVTTESQPLAFVKVCVGATAGVEVYSVPYHVKLSQAMAVVSPVEGSRTIALAVAVAVQPVAVSVTFTVYVPALAEVAALTTGFCNVEVKVSGPVHSYVTALVEGVEVRCRSPPEHGVSAEALTVSVLPIVIISAGAEEVQPYSFLTVTV
jgi:hypothetical protein